MTIHRNKSFLIVSLLVLLVLFESITFVACSEKYTADTPATFAESAFDDELYFARQEPYASYPCLPTGIHISQRSDVDQDESRVSMTVSFTLNYKHCKEVVPRVMYGPVSQEGMLEKKHATSARMHFNYTSPTTLEFFQSDWIYHVELPDLEAGSKEYWYRILVEKDDTFRSLLRGGASLVAGTPKIRFRTPPLPMSPTTIALIGDLGQTINSTKTMAHMYKGTHHKDPVSLVMIVGDMSYADSDPHRWKSWMELMEPLFRTTPLEVAVGNHEIECDEKTHNVFVQYEHYFHNANRLGPAETKPLRQQKVGCSTPSQFLGHYDYGNAFYTFRHGLVSMIVLNSYTDTSRGSPQYEWLEQTLRLVDRSVTPWIVVAFHCPLYTTFVGHAGEAQSVRMKAEMEPLLVQHGVNLVVSGHDHAYMRSKPMAFGKEHAGGPIHLIVGAGGNREEHASGYLHDEPEPWVAVRDRTEYGYGHLHVANATHARLHWIRDDQGGMQDHVWIHNNHHHHQQQQQQHTQTAIL